MRDSIWKDTVKIKEFDKLNNDVKTDVLIIGGGISGILCSYFLKNAGVENILVEGSTIASGTTKNTIAKITSQHGLIYQSIIKNYGVENAKLYYEANQRALLKYYELNKKLNFDFEVKDSFVYSVNDKKKIENEVDSLNLMGVQFMYKDSIEVPIKICGAVGFSKQAQMNPLKFISIISTSLNILENTFVNSIEDGVAYTNRGKIYADYIIVCTHFPFLNKYGRYFLKLYQHRSYVSAYESDIKLNSMYVDEDLKGMSFRTYNNSLIIGGGGHRTGKKGGNWHEITSFAQKNYPDATVKYQWAAQDCMSLDGIPYIGRYSKITPNIFVATGFNKWGMTSSMVAADILTDMVLERKNEYSKIFSPHRSMLKPQLLINGFEATVNLLNPTGKRCPHMGCALKWNSVEHTWDCPCHGSRFENTGKLIDNPSTKDLK